MNFTATAVTSASFSIPPHPPLSPFFQALDATAVGTLRDCMQTSFEDGPKRDRRLWIGTCLMHLKCFS